MPTIVVDPEFVPDAVILDESPAGQDEDTDQTVADADPPAGRDSVDFDFTGAFTDGTDYGNDVPGDTQYSLLLTSQNLASGLFALDVTDAATNDDDGYGQGEPILLYQVDATTVIGYVGESPADGEDYTTYFTITIDPDTGVGTFTQTENVWHADTTNDDDTSFLDIVDGDLTIEEGAIAPWAGARGEYFKRVLIAVSNEFGIPLDVAKGNGAPSMTSDQVPGRTSRASTSRSRPSIVTRNCPSATPRS